MTATDNEGLAPDSEPNHSERAGQADDPSLTGLPDGSGKVKMAELHRSPEQVKGEPLSPVPEDRVSDFLRQLNRAHFWEMPTESQQRGFDGAEWILEGVQDGKYHIAVRWCPSLYARSQEDAAFAEAGRFLLQLAGHKHSGSC